MGRLGLGLGLGLVLVLRQGLGLAIGLQLRIGIGFRRNHSWSSTFTPRRNHSLCLTRNVIVSHRVVVGETRIVIVEAEAVHRNRTISLATRIVTDTLKPDVRGTF